MTDVSNEARALAFGPSNVAWDCKSLVINGFKFVVSDRAKNMTTQHDGVTINATTTCYATASDRQPRCEDVCYYGVVEEIMILDYYAKGRVALFKCKWFDSMSRHGMHIDNCGFRVIDMSRELSTDEPYILASQAKQVFYVSDYFKPELGVIVDVTPRHIFEESIDESVILEETVGTQSNVTFDEADESIVRVDCQPEIVIDNT